MKRSNLIIMGLALVLTMTCGPARAQLGALTKRSSGGSVDLAAQQDKVSSEYSAGGALLVKAMGLTIEALGSKEQADKFRAQAKDLKGDAKNKKGCEQIHTLLSNGGKQVDDLIAKADQLTDEQKAKVKESLVSFGGGVAVDAGLVALSVETAKHAQEEVKSNPMAVTKFAPAIYVASILPGDVKAMGQSLGNYVKLAQKNGIEVPAEVTRALSGPQ